MRKQILGMVLALCMLTAFMPIIASAKEGTKYGDYLYYDTNGNDTEAIITDCEYSATEIVIPSEINGLPVTKIDYGAFYNCTRLTSITIPSSVVNIYGTAFENCSKLTSVTIPDSVTSIGEKTFSYCYALESVTIQGGVKSIGEEAFARCSKLASITIPDSVTNIYRDAFYRCSSLTDVYYGGSETEWKKIYIDFGNGPLEKATIHYGRVVQIPTTTATITKSETDTAYTFEVDAEVKYEECYVYAAIYDDMGNLLEIKAVPLETEGKTSITVDKNDNAAKAKVFVWTKTLQSIIETAEEFPLI